MERIEKVSDGKNQGFVTKRSINFKFVLFEKLYLIIGRDSD